MKTMVMIFVSLLLATVISIPVSEATEAPFMENFILNELNEYDPVISRRPLGVFKTWKSTEHYAFSYVDGFLDSYNPGEKVVFTVEGTSNKLNVDQLSGFDMVAWLIDESDEIKQAGTRLDLNFNPDKRSWQVSFAAPRESNKEYLIRLVLYCKKLDSLCADAYGFPTQVDKGLTLKIR